MTSSDTPAARDDYDAGGTLRERLALVERDQRDSTTASRELREAIHELATQMHGIREQLSTVGRPDWRTLLAGAVGIFGIVSTMVGAATSIGALLVVLYVTPLKQEIAALRSAVKANITTLHGHADMPGHAGSLMQYSTLAESRRKDEEQRGEARDERIIKLLERAAESNEDIARKRIERK